MDDEPSGEVNAARTHSNSITNEVSMENNKIDKNTPLPAHSKEWDEGWRAFGQGQPKTANPYDVQTQTRQHMRWNIGWEAHEYQNAK